MVSDERWRTAQQYERGFWQQQAEQIGRGETAQPDWYKWRADQLVARLRSLGKESVTLPDTRALEVGSGPVGLLAFYPASDVTLVDPLADFFASNPALVALRRADARYVTAPGERLPAAAGAVDLAVIENCIDHVKDADGVMAELARVLRPGGTLYLTVNCRSGLGYYIHRSISSLRLDPGHPHTFTPDRVVAFLKKHGFDVDDMQVGSFAEERQADLRSESSRARLKGRLHVSEFLASCIATRQG
jgi:SAM-dependent methyltransferase